MKHTYYVDFTANNFSTYNKESYVFTNKKEAIKLIKGIIRAEHFHQKYNSSTYIVYNEQDIIVAKGSYNDNGWWVIDKDDIGTKISSL